MTKGEVIIIPDERVQGKILIVRGLKVMLDSDLAELYQVETKILIQSVKRNSDRFPSDFMFPLSIQEVINLRSQIVTSSFHILLPLIGNENVLGIYLNFFLLLDSTL